MRNGILLLLLVAAVICVLSVSAVAVHTVDRSTMTNKIMCGYQGWHMCPGDGNDPSMGWYHWSESNSDIGPGLYHTEVWPQTSEYNGSDLFFVPNTTLTYGGTPYLYSARRQGATNTHFRWMLENGIDGVFEQRFAAEMYGGFTQAHFDTVIQNVMNSATTYGRVWCLEYDISGCTDDMVYDRLVNDWTYLNNNWNIKNHPRYLYHGGKPVIAIWGFGYPDRCGTPAIAQAVIDYFKGQGCWVIGGVPGGWRTQDPGDTKQDPAWNGVFRSYNTITPWTVGAYVDWNGINWWKNNRIIPDLNECNSLGIHYMATMWPRFGWDNMNHYPCGQSDISPRGGQHLWDQIYAWKSAGVPTQFLAMFDEYDESTAIMKLTDNIPTGACFWNTEGYGEDWYLRLANQASKMQRGEIGLSQTIPISSGTSPDNAQVISDTIPTSMTPGQQYSVSVTMRNIGETVWSWDLFKLGAVDDSDPFAPGRVNLPVGNSVAPNEQYTFNFTMTAPTTPGTYTSDWRMVHDIIRWFGGTLVKVINVGAQSQTPYAGVIPIPGTIQCENFDNGGEGVAYHDTTGGNIGGAYRSTDVDIEATADTGGGYNVGWTEGGEWLEYTVNVATTGDYSIKVRLAGDAVGSFRVKLDGNDLTGAKAFGPTGGWQNWTSIIVPTRYLSAGQHIFQLYLESGYPNFNHIDIVSNGSDAVSIDLDSASAEDGLSHPQDGDGHTTGATIGGHNCRRNLSTGDDYYMYFNVTEAYAYQGSRPSVSITVEYYDTGSGALGLNYDSTSDAWKYVAGPALTNSNTWKTHTWNLTDAYFGNRENYGADFRVGGIAGAYFYLDTVVAQPFSGPVTISNSAFNSGVDGWTASTWRAATQYSYGTMAWNSGAGNPGGGMRSTGSGTSDNTDRCTREGGIITKTISTAGYSNIKVYYDLGVNTLGTAKTGAGSGTCAVDHNLIDEQLTVSYTTNGSTWTEAEYLLRSALLASYQSWGTRLIDLTGVPAVNNNPNFGLRFRWQFNQSSDQGNLDNIVVTAN